MPERLTKLLEDWYSDAVVGVTLLANGRVSAVLTSSAFEGMDYADRQRDIWNRLRKALREESTQVSTVYAVTPEEAQDILPPAEA